MSTFHNCFYDLEARVFTMMAFVLSRVNQTSTAAPMSVAPNHQLFKLSEHMPVACLSCLILLDVRSTVDGKDVQAATERDRRLELRRNAHAFRLDCLFVL